MREIWRNDLFELPVIAELRPAAIEDPKSF
jgi:hypothetical protein